MHSFSAVATALVMPTITGKEAAMLILRWFHFIAGITWVGLLYFFNLVNVPFMKTVEPGTKPSIFQNLTLPALNWFRWSALVTVSSDSGIGASFWSRPQPNAKVEAEAAQSACFFFSGLLSSGSCFS